MVRGLRRRYNDRFSDYFSPESLAKFNEEISGHFSGIGLSVIPLKRGLGVSQVFKGSPADQAGIGVGEMIVSVDGRIDRRRRQRSGDGQDQRPGRDQVTIGVLDPKTGKIRQLEITRAEIALPVATGSVKQVDGRKLGYVTLSTFSEGSDALLRKAVEKVEREGAEGIVLDLRENGGGLLDEAVLAREHLPAQGRSRGDDQLAHPGPRRLPDRRRTAAEAARSSS